MFKKVTIDLGGRPLTIETGRLAKQASGTALVTYGETVVLVTATAAKDPKADIDFLPLTVEYQERFYAVGRIPGSFSGVKSVGLATRKPFPPVSSTVPCGPCLLRAISMRPR